MLATSGPGATNLVTGIATAYMDSVPMVAFPGNVATTLRGKDSFQEAYIEGIDVYKRQALPRRWTAPTAASATPSTSGRG